MKIEMHNNTFHIRATDLIRVSPGRPQYGDDWEVYDLVYHRFPVGKVGTLAHKERLGAGSIHDIWLDDEEGVGGNMDPSVKATKGWRGTTDDIACFADGLVEITGVEKMAQGYGYIVSFQRIQEAE